MADNVFSKSPTDIALNQSAQRMRGIREAVAPPPRAMDTDTLSRQHQVPENIIGAAMELADIEGDDLAGFAESFSSVVGQHIAAGRTVDEAVRLVLPQDGAGDAVLRRAVEMVAPAPDQAEQPVVAGEGTTALGDIARRGAASVMSGTGAMVEGLGRAAAERGRHEGSLEFRPDGIPDLVLREQSGPNSGEDAAREAGDWFRDQGENIARGIDKGRTKAMQDSIPSGDLFAPSTWAMPENPSVEGLAHLTVEVLGSMAPVILASLLSRNPAVAAGVGGAQSAGAGADTAREVIAAAASDTDKDGISRLERESPYFQKLIARGHTQEEAVALTSQAAERTAAGWAAIPGALGGAATGRLLQGPIAGLAAKGPITRVLATAGIGALEEGSQEVLESIAARQGIAESTGMEIDLTADTVEDFVLGALGGGPIGGLGALRGSRKGEPPEEPEAAPTQGPDVPPKGPISRAAQIAPPPPAEIEPMAANQPKGARVQITIPGGKPIDAEFQEETEEGITFKAEGGPFFVPREQIESGEVVVDPVDPLTTARREAEGENSAPSPYDDQTAFDVITEIQHAITFANKRGNGSVRGVPVADPAAQEAFLAGAQSALAGAADAPVMDSEELSAAAMAGFDLARNKAETRRAPASETGAPVAAPRAPAPKPATPARPSLKKRPFTDAIKKHGGIDPTGPLAAELRHQGIDASTTPGLFRKGAAASLDNLPVSEWAEYAHHIGDDGNGYLSEQGIIDAIVNEAAGNPLQVGEQIELQAEADARAELEELRAQGAVIDDSGLEEITVDQAENDGIIPPREQIDDFAPDDRVAFIQSRVREELTALGATLDGREVQRIVDLLDENGGSVEDALWWQLEQEPEQYDQPEQQDNEDTGPPLTEPEVSGSGIPDGAGSIDPDTQRSDRVRDGEEKGATGSGTSGRSAQAEGREPTAQKPRKPEKDAKTELTERPAGFTFKLADRLPGSDQRLLAKHRDTNVGDIIAQIDGVARRAELSMRRGGSDVRNFDIRGQDPDGNWDQMASVVGEAEVIARELLKEARAKKTGDLPYPPRDEATGEYESDGTAMGYALEWLVNVEAMGLPLDEIIEPENATSDVRGVDSAEPPVMPQSDIFQTPAQIVNLIGEAKKVGFISLEAAKAELARWKEVAKEIGRTNKNENKVIISLYDYTGAWSQPWADAGYQVIRHDIKQGSDVMTDQWIFDRIREYREAGMEIYGVLSACPCTTFSGAGARWWADLHDVESPEAVEKVFGRNATLSGAKSPVEYNKMLYEATRDVIAEAAPTNFHVLENPIGRIQEVTGLKKPTLKFHPHNFGDPYTKQTQLFGEMKTDLPLANVDPVEGSKMQNKLRGNDPLGKEQRSTTPEGFAYAFFMANDPDARKQKAKKRTTTRKNIPENIPAQPTSASEAESVETRKLPGKHGKVPISLVKLNVRKWPEGYDVSGSYDVPGFGGGTLTGPYRQYFDTPAEAVAAALKSTIHRNSLPTKVGSPYPTKRMVDDARKIRAFLEDNARPDAWSQTEVTPEGEQSLIPGVKPVTEKDRAETRMKAPKRGGNAPADFGLFDTGSRQQADLFSDAAPSKEEIDAAAAETDPAPTPAQAEAGNYKKGRFKWNGLDLVIETAKGEERRGVGRDGKEWSVTMPAHYGDVKRTEGADGDPVDFYMGDNPDSNTVVIVNQVDPDTGKFDEHKVILGASIDTALQIYKAGFSDGSGEKRLGSWSATDVDSFKGWLKDQEATKKPTTKVEGTQAEKDKPAPTSYGAANTLVSKDRAAELRERLKAKLRDQLNAGFDPEILAIGAELAAFHIEAGARTFVDLAKAIADDLGTTPDKLRPYLRGWYNGARDMMEDNDVSIEGMDGPDAVRQALGTLAAEPKRDTLETPPQAQAAEQEVEPNDNRDNGGDDRTGAQEGAPVAEEGAEEPGAVRAPGGEPGGDGNQSAERPAERSEPDGDGARNRDAIGADGSPDRPRARNHVIPAGGLTLAKGEKTRARESVAAIRTLRDLEASGLPATPEQREALAKYGGAGTLANALRRADGTARHEDLAAELDELLSAEEAETLARTSQYAFYTAESVLRGMWRAAQHLGFNGGRVYEPGMGVGGFAGTVPDALRADTAYEGLELDHITAKIAAKLYPAHKIKQGDFIKALPPQNYYDLVIGNPPFSATRIEADKDYPQRFMIHDYFFAKSLDAVRPGGLLMFVTSAGTMNKLDAKARDYLADRADLVGAVRLPNTAFKENGTEVTTDIVILRKRMDGETEANAGWRESDRVNLPTRDGGEAVGAVNRYFIENPDMVLGEQGLFDELTGSLRLGVRPRPGSDLAADLHQAMAKLPANVMSEPSQDVKLEALDTDSAEKKTGSFYLAEDGTLMQYDGRAGRPVQQRGKGVTGGKSKAEMETIRRLIPIRDGLRDVYAADLAGGDAAAARKELNRAYDAFVRKNGPIGKQVRSFRRPSAVEMEGIRQQALQDARAAGQEFDIGSFDPSEMLDTSVDPETDEPRKPASMREVAAARKKAMEAPDYVEGDFNPDDVPDKVLVKRPNIDPFMDDPESFRLLAIEAYDEKTDTAQKSAIFTESTVSKSIAPEINSPEDALLYLLAETGRIDLDQIAEKAGSDPDTVRRELSGKIFLNPATREYETKTKYLSGNVREKLEQAEKAALTQPEFLANVTSLQKVQPDPVTSEDIRVPIGAHWFDGEVYADFAKSLGLSLKVKFNRQLGIWAVIGGDTTSAAARNEWGTQDKPFGDLMALLLNNKKIEIRRTDSETKKTWVDEEATQLAKDKAKELQDKFSEWFWEDDGRTAEMEDIYNKTFNSEVAPKYDGGYLTTPGINSAWRWRPHQTSVIARILQSGSTYMAHTVGAGKTSAMIGAGMEARRLGLAKKPMYAVPNHMLVQFTTEFYQQYPLAKILVADEKRFHTSTRKQFIADAALGDWDAIIITHSGFEKIPPSEAAVNRVVEGMLKDIKSVLTDTPESGFGSGGQGEERGILSALGSMASMLGLNTQAVTKGENSTRKKIEALIEAAEQRMSRQIDRRDQDQVFNFDELGVDMLFYDEAHLRRKLSFATTNSNIKGVDPAGARSSMDLFIKTRALDAINPGRGLVLASGTPITNTMAELYSISRYMQPDALKQRGLDAFDAWASTFGSVESELEQLPDGGYKQVARFSKFVNTPELSLMVRQVMDVVTGADLEQYVTRPKLVGGKRNLVVVEPSEEVRAFQSTLAARMDAIARRKGPPKKGDDILLSVINDGRLSAIDARLVSPDATGANSKLEKLIQNVYRTWKQGANSPLHGVKPEGGYTDAPIEHGPTTQIVFSTLGLNPTKHNPSFAVHRFIRAELIRLGVPAGDIILADEMKSHAMKQRAFNDMNEGKKRILIGSKTLFTGVNAQRRLYAVHNLDPLWFPADDEQRNGRALRQGNMNPEIEIFDYSTKGTYDATMWQMMGRKAGFIEGFFRGDPSMREMEDLGEASQYQQATALSTRDPRVLELTEMRQKRDEMDRRRSAIESQKRRLDHSVRAGRQRIERWTKELGQWKEAAGKVVDLKGDKFVAQLGGAAIDVRKDFGQAIIDMAIEAEENGKTVRGRRIGDISGFPILFSFSPSANLTHIDIVPFEGHIIEAGFSFEPVGLARRIEHVVGGIAHAPENIETRIGDEQKDIAAAQEQRGKVKEFAQLQELRLLEEQIDNLETTLETEAEADQKARSGDQEMRNLNISTEITPYGVEPAGWVGVDADPPITDEQIAEIAEDVDREMANSGLAGKITATVVRKIHGVSNGAEGVYRRGRARIEVHPDAGPGAVGVVHHEIIHALRDSQLWNSKAGLFSPEEWRGLVREARKDKAALEELRERYAGLPESAILEEAVAEMYRRWRSGAWTASPAVSGAFGKVKAFFEALGNAFRGRGFQSAARTMQMIADGRIGARGRAPSARSAGPVQEMRPRKNNDYSRAPHVKAKSLKDGISQIASDALTQAMSGAGGTNIMALVPGRPLISELGSKLPSMDKYLRLKEQMDALRNHLHAETDELAQKWRRRIAKNRAANDNLMELMHDSTIEGIDPTLPFIEKATGRDRDLVSRWGTQSKTGGAAQERLDDDARRRVIYDDMRERYERLPPELRAIYSQVRDAYSDMERKFEKAIEANAKKAMTIAVRRAERAHAKRLDEIRDEGLTGKERREAIKDADETLKTAKMMNAWSKNARVNSLRARFESNKLIGPYFPLARFGNFYVTLRNREGVVESFSMFEKRSEQRKFAAEMKAEGFDVETGVMSEIQARDAVDPGFVADVEGLLEEISADASVMDAIWQRWLQTLPDMSQRRHKLHRKGTPGYSGDAFRAFGHQMFHSAHQLARLTYGLDMAEAIDVAKEEAKASDDPERAGLVVNEVSRRHEYIMNPKGSWWAQAMTSAAFVYYLSMTPAAALVNLTQTSVVGTPILGAFYGKGGIKVAARELIRASHDFTKGRGHAAGSKRLNEFERRAMKEAYDMGTIDKSQSHDLAGVGETGVEYSPVRTRVMGIISFMFHHAERMNREVTFLAAYRMAKKKGQTHKTAVRTAADLTWRTHFDYQNTSRPRLLQNDYLRVAMVFRNFNLNMLWRLFRDSHQAFSGDTPAAKAEARRQLVGISASMLFHSGIKGVWGYSLILSLVGLLFPGGSDEAEQEMEKIMLSVLPREIVGAFLNGIPGHLAGVDLTARIGMPDLWFRSPNREMEGEDEFNYWVMQILGAAWDIPRRGVIGYQKFTEGVQEGDFWTAYRGIETAVPKALRDVMRAGRFTAKGAETYNQDPIVEEFRPGELFAQAIGFTPARLTERYTANTRLKNAEVRIIDERRRIMRKAGKQALGGSGITDAVVDEIAKFNAKYPEYPITNDALKQSIRSRHLASSRNELGVQLNPRLNERLRGTAAPLIYQD